MTLSPPNPMRALPEWLQAFQKPQAHASTQAEPPYQLTVMFCDLVGSTALSELLPPEQLWRILSAYQEACAGVIEPLKGYIAQYLGDGILAYFGYPAAHQDDVDRSVRAALGILQAIAKLNNRLMANTGMKLAVRVGIHTGEVVVKQVGTGKKRQPLAIGATPNIAARLQNLAAENSVALSAASYQQLQGAFPCEYLGLRSLKGISHPMEVYQLLHSGSAPAFH